MKPLSILLLLFLPLTMLGQDTIFSSNEDSLVIPQGEVKFEIYFSEFGGRMQNPPCLVIINGRHIVVRQTKETNMTGGEIIIEGELMLHISNRWIIGKSIDDVNAKEIGGCSGGPVPIDFKTRIIEWC